MVYSGWAMTTCLLGVTKFRATLIQHLELHVAQWILGPLSGKKCTSTCFMHLNMPIYVILVAHM